MASSLSSGGVVGGGDTGKTGKKAATAGVQKPRGRSRKSRTTEQASKEKEAITRRLKNKGLNSIVKQFKYYDARENKEKTFVGTAPYQKHLAVLSPDETNRFLEAERSIEVQYPQKNGNHIRAEAPTFPQPTADAAELEQCRVHFHPLSNNERTRLETEIEFFQQVTDRQDKWFPDLAPRIYTYYREMTPTYTQYYKARESTSTPENYIEFVSIKSEFLSEAELEWSNSCVPLQITSSSETNVSSDYSTLQDDSGVEYWRHTVHVLIQLRCMVELTRQLMREFLSARQIFSFLPIRHPTLAVDYRNRYYPYIEGHLRSFSLFLNRCASWNCTWPPPDNQYSRTTGGGNNPKEKEGGGGGADSENFEARVLRASNIPFEQWRLHCSKLDLATRMMILLSVYHPAVAKNKESKSNNDRKNEERFAMNELLPDSFCDSMMSILFEHNPFLNDTTFLDWARERMSRYAESYHQEQIRQRVRDSRLQMATYVFPLQSELDSHGWMPDKPNRNTYRDQHERIDRMVACRRDPLKAQQHHQNLLIEEEEANVKFLLTQILKDGSSRTLSESFIHTAPAPGPNSMNFRLTDAKVGKHEDLNNSPSKANAKKRGRKKKPSPSLEDTPTKKKKGRPKKNASPALPSSSDSTPPPPSNKKQIGIKKRSRDTDAPLEDEHMDRRGEEENVEQWERIEIKKRPRTKPPHFPDEEEL